MGSWSVGALGHLGVTLGGRECGRPLDVEIVPAMERYLLGLGAQA